MALVKEAVQASIKAKLDGAYGPPADLIEQAKFTGALADWLIEILKDQMDIATTGTCSGSTAVGPAGGPLPITAQPTTGSGTVT
jgi:hypothetical protein